MASASRNNQSFGKVGIIAGRGELPLELAASLTRQSIPFHFLLVKDEADPDQYQNYPYDTIPITKVGRFLKILSTQGCQTVTLAGPVSRPNFKSILPDTEGLKLLTRIGGALSKGDDGLMNAITDFIAEKGFTLMGAHEFDEQFVLKTGVFGQVCPTDEEQADIDIGAKICRQIGEMDVGQAIVIRNGYVLGVEAAEGTEQMIDRCRSFAWDQPAGLLVKLPKPGQNLKADMPTIGPETIDQVAKANLRGIVVEAANSLIVEADEVREKADRANVFIVAIDPKAAS